VQESLEGAHPVEACDLMSGVLLVVKWENLDWNRSTICIDDQKRLCSVAILRLLFVS
jgi:hypothetical protein